MQLQSLVPTITYAITMLQNSIAQYKKCIHAWIDCNLNIDTNYGNFGMYMAHALKTKNGVTKSYIQKSGSNATYMVFLFFY